MKKIVSLIITAAMLLTSFTTVMAEDTIEVLVDGKYVEFDVEPMLVNDRTLVPVRAVFNALGAVVDWNGETQSFTAVKGDTAVSMTLNENVIVINGEGVLLDTKSILVNDRILVPLRAVSEAFDCNVQWNKYNTSVVVVSDPSAVKAAEIDGEVITLADFSASMMFYLDNFYSQNDGGQEWLVANWATQRNALAEYLFNELAFQKKYSKNPSAADMEAAVALTESGFDTFSQNMGGTEATHEWIKKNNITEDSFKDYLAERVLTNKTLEYERNKIPQYKIQQYIDENLFCAKHILFATDGTPESDAEKKALADETLKKIKRGENFDKLMNELCEDPGLATNPNGYVFGTGEMVTEFEEAVKALKIGQISEVVKSPYGYHIIKREKVDYDTVKDSVISEIWDTSELVNFEYELITEQAVIDNLLPTDFS